LGSSQRLKPSRFFPHPRNQPADVPSFYENLTILGNLTNASIFGPKTTAFSKNSRRWKLEQLRKSFHVRDEIEQDIQEKSLHISSVFEELGFEVALHNQKGFHDQLCFSHAQKDGLEACSPERYDERRGHFQGDSSLTRPRQFECSWEHLVCHETPSQFEFVLHPKEQESTWPPVD